MDPARVLGEIVSKIMSYKVPRKILLFGSRARDEQTAVSDIDIAIVDPTWTRVDVALVHDLVEEEVRTPLKIDILALHLVRRDELRRRILEEGRVLYERHDSQHP